MNTVVVIRTSVFFVLLHTFLWAVYCNATVTIYIVINTCSSCLIYNICIFGRRYIGGQAGELSSWESVIKCSKFTFLVQSIIDPVTSSVVLPKQTKKPQTQPSNQWAECFILIFCLQPSSFMCVWFCCYIRLLICYTAYLLFHIIKTHLKQKCVQTRLHHDGYNYIQRPHPSLAILSRIRRCMNRTHSLAFVTPPLRLTPPVTTAESSQCGGFVDGHWLHRGEKRAATLLWALSVSVTNKPRPTGLFVQTLQ